MDKLKQQQKEADAILDLAQREIAAKDVLIEGLKEEIEYYKNITKNLCLFIDKLSEVEDEDEL